MQTLMLIAMLMILLVPVLAPLPLAPRAVIERPRGSRPLASAAPARAIAQRIDSPPVARAMIQRPRRFRLPAAAPVSVLPSFCVRVAPVDRFRRRTPSAEAAQEAELGAAPVLGDGLGAASPSRRRAVAGLLAVRARSSDVARRPGEHGCASPCLVRFVGLAPPERGARHVGRRKRLRLAFRALLA